MGISKIDLGLTMDYLTNSPESLYLDRKKAKISMQDLANEIASFANANGGIVVVGISDDGVVEGFNQYGIKKLNECQKVVSNFLHPVPIYECELIDVVNVKKEEDKILLFHIKAMSDYLVRNNKDEVYYRQGDSSIKLTHDQIRSLEYDKKERDFESEILMDSSIDDIDEEAVNLYKEKLNTDVSNEQILKARGFLKEVKGNLHLTKAGMLLFGKNPSLYIPTARVRVIKFEGKSMRLGTEMNVTKDKTFDSCLYKTIEQVTDFIKSQLREFTYLNSKGIFETVPEYPEVAWYEGLINAVAHRDYNFSGDYVKIKLYDDRLEISSPGKLCGFVTLENIKNERYSRNPLISRTLTEFGIVRELNEGVKRIYSEMEKFFLKDPVFSEPNHHSVLLVLYNNIIMRGRRKEESIISDERIQSIWNELNYAEREVLVSIYDKGEITAEEVSSMVNRGRTTAIKILNKLKDLQLIEWNGTSKSDNKGKYIIKD